MRLRPLHIILVLLALLVVGAFVVMRDVPAPPGEAAASRVVASPTPAARATGPSPIASSASPAPASPAVAKPTTATKPAAANQGQSPAQGKPANAPDVDRERIVRDATWTPGQLASHFEKHGREGPWASESVYDASARETVQQGTFFTYQDRESNAERLGFYDKAGNRFTAVTRDGRRIATHFRPDRGEAYVRGLSRSTYR